MNVFKKMVLSVSALVAAVTLHAQVQNKAAVFSGTPACYASFGTITELNNAPQFSFEAWVYLDEWVENSYIFRKMATVGNRLSVQLGKPADKRLYFHVANGSNSYAASNNVPINVGEWHHLSVRYDGTKSAYNMIQVFVDGAAVPLWYQSGNGLLPATTPDNTASVELGAASFKGKLDDVRLWSTALSGTPVQMKNTINTYHPLYSALIAYWKMDDQTAAIADQKNNYPGTGNGLIFSPVTDNTAFRYRTVSSYIRSNFYESGQISRDALLQNNDLIYLAANPYADGSIFFEYPENHGTLTNATYLSSFDGRSGVLDFAGTGAVMNAGKDLLNTATGGVKTFTFATWIYLDSWAENSYVFRKQASTNSSIDLQLGAASTNTLYVHVSNGSNSYIQLNNAGLTTGQWHHVAVTYNGNGGANNQVKIYVDGISKSGFIYSTGNGLLPASGPFIRNDFELGVNLDGKLDETVLNLLSLAAGDIQTLKNNPLVVTSWNQTKTAAYWKYDDSQQPGLDSRTWKGVLSSLKSQTAGVRGITLRLGVIGGDWKAMIASAPARAAFVENIKNLVAANGFDGVDLDFEWATTTQEWTNYDLTIQALAAALPPSSQFSVTLHPLYYKISAASIAALDQISIQSYGPSPDRFPYNEFVNNVSTMLAYGYPKEKLIMGLPFYGTTADKTTAAYDNVVAAYPALDPALDEVSMMFGGVEKQFIFNGQQTIRAKADYVVAQDLAGVMYWDVATDVDVVHPLSLLQALSQVMDANLDNSGNQTLPVKWQGFTAGKTATGVLLQWQTGQEENTRHFVVERSLDGVSFTAIGNVEAAGLSTTTRHYTYADRQPLSGRSYYRLQQVDRDGKVSISAVVAVWFGAPKPPLTGVYPNPASSVVFLPDGNLENVKQVSLAGISGAYYPVMRNGARLTLPTSLPAGTYYIRVLLEDGTAVTHKLLVER